MEQSGQLGLKLHPKGVVKVILFFFQILGQGWRFLDGRCDLLQAVVVFII
jgi:hypothetical protein